MIYNLLAVVKKGILWMSKGLAWGKDPTCEHCELTRVWNKTTTRSNKNGNQRNARCLTWISRLYRVVLRPLPESSTVSVPVALAEAESRARRLKALRLGRKSEPGYVLWRLPNRCTNVDIWRARSPGSFPPESTQSSHCHVPLMQL
jgi:hypothetical protein